MANYAMGDVIRESRLRKGITQEKLCEGICTPGTLSKIENGNQIPGRRTYEALMQRLGEPALLMTVYTGEAEFRRYKLCVKALRAVAWEDLKEAENLLIQYKKELEVTNILGRQFFMFTEALYHSLAGGEPKQILKELDEAMQLTRNGFSLKESMDYLKKQHFYTFLELYILNNMAIQLWEAGRKRQAKQMLECLKLYLEQHDMDEEEKARIYPAILGNLAVISFKEGHFSEARVLFDRGIHMCVRYGRMYALPYLLHNKGCGLLAHRKKIEARWYFRQAGYLYHAGGKEKVHKHLRGSQARMIMIAF